ncbi:3'-5' exonuclease [Hoyosella altamirensis]|uniref:3'-5' exonuclease n=1 Tax=Hoyosella altamirensis TaxID=616997 RepID=UPI0007DB4398|nr:3'-5' exonuclease [Hoyosella altamirensis]
MKPTSEQQAIIDAVTAGHTICVHAFAGSGKTSVLKMCANARPQTSGLYVAYNKAIQLEAAHRFPDHIDCRTGHGLAYRAVGHRYQHRLQSRARMTTRDKAQLIGTTDAASIGNDLYLSYADLTRAVMGTIDRFCKSGDHAISDVHVPHVMGARRLTPSEHRELAKSILPYAEKSWAEHIIPSDGKLPFQHDYYLKLWQLSDPVLHTDLILYDECQPPGTLVDTPAGRVPIEDLKVGDRVVSYNQSSLRLAEGGSPIEGITSKPFLGELVTVQAGERLTRYTPNHHCIAYLGDVFVGKWLLYLMRKDNSFRVGITQFKHGDINRKRAASGLRGRLREEKADAIWVLDVFGNRGDALLEERYISSLCGIPDVRFQQTSTERSHFTQERLDAFWGRCGDLTLKANLLLNRYGRDIKYPIAERGPRQLVFSRATIIRAANLLEGMSVLDVDRLREAGGRGSHDGAWLQIGKIEREQYAGQVFSMTVAGNHTYVGDGIVTHNCQDADPCISAVVQAQSHAQLVTVGDSFQQIYAWRGAQDALSNFPGEVLELTRSFRFGPAVADEANKWLQLLGSRRNITGNSDIASRITNVEVPDAILCRSNAGVIKAAITLLAAGRTVSAKKGLGTTMTRLAEAAQQLQTQGFTSHPELSVFKSWDQVREHVEQDEAASDLRVFVDLIDDKGPEQIIRVATQLKAPGRGDVMVCTAHTAKGLEWPEVMISSDFRKPPVTEDRQLLVRTDEARLAYVSVTRAQNVLDRKGLAWVDEIDGLIN